ncbi:MAG: hypothetical protein OXG37_16650 [Actinomycetia bacterium]|nr:hypothetical protein [Actinomycetes bacterium]
MDKRERKDILGQWGVRGSSVREQERAELIDRDLEGSPMKGRRLRARLRNFRPALDRYVTSLGGPLPYMQRLRAIDEKTEEWLRALDEAWRKVAQQCRGDATAFAGRWRERVEACDFGEVNDMIECHNRFFPTEARLPMDVKRRDFVLIRGEPYRKPLLDDAWVLERFPPDLDAALGRPDRLAPDARRRKPAARDLKR